jgi:hypothetical protein
VQNQCHQGGDDTSDGIPLQPDETLPETTASRYFFLQAAPYKEMG